MRTNRLEQRAAALERRRDVEHRQLVDPLAVVTRGQFGRIAGLTQSFEVHALDDAAVAHVEAGDESFRQHGRLGTVPDGVEKIPEHLEAVRA